MPRQHPLLTAMYAPMLALAQSALINHVQGDDPTKAVMAALHAELAQRAQLKAAHAAIFAAMSQAPVAEKPGPPGVATPAQTTTRDANRAPPAPQAASPTRVDPAVTRPARAEPRPAPAATPRAPAPERSDPPMTSMFIPRAPAPRGPAKPAPRAAPVKADLERAAPATPPARPAPAPNFKPLPGAPSGLISAYERAAAAIAAGRQPATPTPATPANSPPPHIAASTAASRTAPANRSAELDLQPPRAAPGAPTEAPPVALKGEAPGTTNPPIIPEDGTEQNSDDDADKKRKALRRAIIARDKARKGQGHER